MRWLKKSTENIGLEKKNRTPMKIMGESHNFTKNRINIFGFRPSPRASGYGADQV